MSLYQPHIMEEQMRATEFTKRKLLLQERASEEKMF